MKIANNGLDTCSGIQKLTITGAIKGIVKAAHVSMFGSTLMETYPEKSNFNRMVHAASHAVKLEMHGVTNASDLLAYMTREHRIRENHRFRLHCAIARRLEKLHMTRQSSLNVNYIYIDECYRCQLMSYMRKAQSGADLPSKTIRKQQQRDNMFI